MSETTTASDPRSIASHVILRQLGARRVALWLDRPVNTIYVWLKRGTDAEPFPLREAMTLFDRARAEGIYFDIRLIAPAVPAGRV